MSVPGGTDGLSGYGSLAGERVFVTGGSIGEAMASTFSGQGTRIAFVNIAVESGLALCERVAAEEFEKLVNGGQPAYTTTTSAVVQACGQGFSMPRHTAAGEP